MRLINTKTYAFEEFIGRNIPKYAILSHTWEEEEVSFADVTSNPRYKEKKGWNKIDMTCQLALTQGYQYAWVDTCCIDKSSSAELTEAINSMFRWYQRAEFCYVFLSDMPTPGEGEPIKSLGDCRWFTRGWTLQELIAPRLVVFLDQTWNWYGDKISLGDELATITGISPFILNHRESLSAVSVAQKMSWAASRETTRIEDTAYCLLGIFDVNMPLLYGEEDKAFRRLQEEIIKTTPDMSIFAWRLPESSLPDPSTSYTTVSGLLADSPRYFTGCGTVARVRMQSDSREFTITHRGVKIQGRDILVKHLNHGNVEYRYILPLNCGAEVINGPYVERQPIGILLRKSDREEFVRGDPMNWVYLADDDTMWVWADERPEVSSGLRYILTSLPNDNASTEDRKFFAPESGTLQYRGLTYLQITQPSWALLERAWPLGFFDLQEQLFFCTHREEVREVFAIVEFKLDFGTEPFDVSGPGIGQLKLAFIFLAIGQYPQSLGTMIFDFGLIDVEKYAAALQGLGDLRGPGRRGLRHRLRHSGIPKLSADIIELADSDQVVLLSFTPVPVFNPYDKSSSPYHKVTFHAEHYHKDKVPWFRIKQGEW
ncbi:heterokaryon incompatibility protein-domain-containing protein [Cercophora newfieldiana]|uniref:Heterokaryon incompatibility protein-domain-containing protein n=1 Tax=Cercophora newfieldiana TaxID=92897 RepID=A0AA39YU74_9PEZI|nr:heterokaryon incompatibility protein-domain-containing protein [Cercophora newfieldiana]